MSDRIKEIEAILRQRQRGIVRDEPDEGPLSERDEMLRQIDLRRQKEIREDEQNARLAAEQAEQDFEDALIAEEERAWEEEYENDAHLMDPETILYNFSELDPDEGGFSDLWQNEEIKRPILDAIDVAIGEDGHDPMDWRVYEKIGNQFRERLQALEENSGLKTNFDREDALNRIRAKRIREVAVDNEYFERGLLKREPESQEEIVQRFVREFPDVGEDPRSFGDAIKHVDQAQVSSHVDKSQIRTDYEIYREAGQQARTRNALRELAIARGQNPDDI